MFFDRVRAYIAKHQLLAPGQPLVVGVSGGTDSIALLNVLNNLKEDYNIHLIVAHFNHGLRPEAADDAEFVWRTAQAWGLECVVEKTDVKALAEEKGLSLEEAGRLARYTFFATLGDRAAVAHHADDQAETVLMHFLRGSGAAGLRGMRPLNQQTVNGRSLTIIRPFLEVTRAEIEAYLAEHQLPFVTDASNADTQFFRNRLRHELLPVLQTYNPNIREVLGRTAEVMAEDYVLLQSVVQEAWMATRLGVESERVRFKLDRWRVLPLGLRRGLLREALTRLRPDLRNLDFTPLESGLTWAQTAHSGHTADLLAGLALAVVGNELQVLVKHSVAIAEPASVSLAVPGETQFLNYRFTTTLVDQVSLADIKTKDAWTAYLNSKLAPFTVRARRPGDRFAPLGLAGSLKLSDYLINTKLPLDARDTWPLVCCGPEAETIVWVGGAALADSAKVVEGQQAVKITVVRS